jgi:hypothetical protein
LSADQRGLKAPARAADLAVPIGFRAENQGRPHCQRRQQIRAPDIPCIDHRPTEFALGVRRGRQGLGRAVDCKHKLAVLRRTTARQLAGEFVAYPVNNGLLREDRLAHTSSVVFRLLDQGLSSEASRGPRAATNHLQRCGDGRGQVSLGSRLCNLLRCRPAVLLQSLLKDSSTRV